MNILDYYRNSGEYYWVDVRVSIPDFLTKYETGERTFEVSMLANEFYDRMVLGFDAKGKLTDRQYEKLEQHFDGDGLGWPEPVPSKEFKVPGTIINLGRDDECVILGILVDHPQFPKPLTFKGTIENGRLSATALLFELKLIPCKE